MNLIQTLVKDLGQSDVPVFISIKTTNGEIRTGSVAHVSNNVLVLEPPTDAGEGENETDLIVTSYFNIDNIICAWLHD